MRYLLIFLLGLVIGGVGTIFLLGSPRAKATPGTRVEAPPVGGDPANTVIISLTDDFLDALLGAVFKDLGPPSFNLASMGSQTGSSNIRPAAFQAGCTNSVTITPEGSNIKTQVQFAGGKITAPMVFTGNYGLLGNCMQFKGWAQTTIQLYFDQPSQALYGRVNVEGVNLEGVAPFANNFLTVFVRTAIDQRVNPLEVLRPSQLQVMIPVRASDGAVKAQAKDVRAEVQDGFLHLHVTYDFVGAKGQQPQT